MQACETLCAGASMETSKKMHEQVLSDTSMAAGNHRGHATVTEYLL